MGRSVDRPCPREEVRRNYDNPNRLAQPSVRTRSEILAEAERYRQGERHGGVVGKVGFRLHLGQGRETDSPGDRRDASDQGGLANLGLYRKHTVYSVGVVDIQRHRNIVEAHPASVSDCRLRQSIRVEASTEVKRRNATVRMCDRHRERKPLRKRVKSLPLYHRQQQRKTRKRRRKDSGVKGPEGNVVFVKWCTIINGYSVMYHYSASPKRKKSDKFSVILEVYPDNPRRE
ncbi:hypothetical protein FOZ62_000573 [Perkinsus olseni]|uniref:Uncharacterized protein n=1 Tax=Perkinsus olseni TaxID=32597 RepID=A0A7J6SG88_PEROL|nr:hypothetical protein FOZ62_000573 [Perkinsus olseni]